MVNGALGGALEMDPRVMLAVTLVGLGVTTVQKVTELWKREGVDDEILAQIQVEVDKRLEMWRDMPPG